MTDGNTRKKAQAVFFSLVMVLSMVGGTVAFAGGAAADTTTIGVDGQDISIGDEQVSIGADGTTQTIDLEKVQDDGANSGGTVTISASAPGDGFEFSSPSVTGIQVHPDGNQLTPEGGDTPDATSTITDGNIVIDLQNDAVGETVDITLEVDLQLANYALSDSTAPVADQVTYTAETDAAQTYEDTFDLIPAEPTVTDASVDTDQPNWIIVNLSENVETTTETPENAFAIDGSFEQASSVNNVIDSSGAEDVDGLDLNSDQVALVLDDFVTSNDASDSPLTGALEATGNDGVALSENTDVNIAANANLDVDTSGVTPLFDVAIVSDNANNEVDVTFTEAVAATDTTALAGTFEWSGVAVVDSASITDRTVTLTLNESVSADADTTGILSSTDLGTELEGDNEGQNGVGAADLSSEDVENNVAPAISGAEVTYDEADGQNYLEVTYDSSVEVSGDAGDIVDAYSLNVDSDAAIDEFVEINDNTVVLSLEPIPVTNDDLTAVGGTPGNGGVTYAAGDATDDIVSTAAFSQTAAATEQNVNVDPNNVKPVVSSVTLNEGDTTQVYVEFTEGVSFADGVNPDTYATANFELSDGTSPLQGAITTVDGTDVVELTFENALNADAQEELTYTANDGIEGQDGTAVVGFDTETVTNNEFPAFVEDASISHAYDANADNGVTPYEITVQFNENLDQVGTDSEVATAFDLELNGPGSNPQITDGDGSAVEVDEEADTITFTVTADKGDENTADLDSASELLASAGNGLSYTGGAANANNPIELGSEEPADFETAVFNEIEPKLEDTGYALADGETTLTVTFTEPVTGPAGETQTDAFQFTGDDAPDITGVSVGDTGDTNNEVMLTFAEVSEDDTAIGNLEFTNGDAIVAAADSTPAGTTTVGVTSPGGVFNPAIQEVVFDDVSVNNDEDETNGQMVVYFDEDVHVNADGDDSTAGLEFQSSQTDVSIDLRDSIIGSGEGVDDHPSNAVIIGTTSASGSLESTVEEGETLDDVKLVVDDPSSVGIQTDGGNDIAEENVTADNINNEIAGDLATVESTEINTELIGTEVDETGGDFTVTVTGLRDSAGNRVIDDTVQVNISGATSSDLEVTPNRFSDTATTSETPEDISKGDVDIGSEATVDVDGADVTNADTVTYVHEAFTASEGYQFESQPMPGEFVATENISDITYYDADASGDEDVFATYGSESEVQDVHNALFVNAESDGAEYGFAYDEDRSGAQTNVGDISMGEGWHIVGSNYDISSSSIELQDDLATENLPSSSAIDVQLKSLPGTTLSDTATVDDHAVYYVYVYQEDNRAIVLPAYSSTADTGSSVNEAPQ